MLNSSLRFLSCLTKTHLPFYTLKSSMPALQQAQMFSFCKTKKHESNQKHPEDKTQQTTEQNIKKHQKNNHQEEKHHQHGPNCTHQYQHHHQKQKEAHHKHGPGCNHEHEHHHQTKVHTQETQIHPKLSKLSFEELIELKTDDALKYANQIYEQQEKKLKALKDQKESLIKAIELFKKADQDINQKEKKLAENIKIVEEETANAQKRADKQIEESKTFAVTKIAKQLLQVADCISNCKKFAEQNQTKDQYIQNVIKSQTIIRQILKKFQIEEFDPTNQQFNANTQQSLVNVPTPPGFKPNHVAMTMRTGYTIKGRLLRSARVGVFI